MDETLEKVKDDLLKLDYIYEEQNEVSSSISKLEGINEITVEGDFFGDKKVKVNISCNKQQLENDLANILISNTKNGTFTPRNNIKEPDAININIDKRKKSLYIFWIVYLYIFFICGLFLGIGCLSFKETASFGIPALLIGLIFGVVASCLSYKLYSKYKIRKEYLAKTNRYKRFISSLANNYTKEIQEKISFISSVIEDFKKQKEEKLEKMKKYVQCTNEIIDSIVTQTELPIHYAKNSAAVSIMLNVILSKRADTLKEMINLYEQDCKLNSIISEIQNSNKIYIQSMSDYQSTIADCSNLITSEMNQLKAIACAPIQITGTSTIYTY